MIFDCYSLDTIKLSVLIENKINETFGFLVKSIIRTDEEFKNIVNNNPFVNEINIELDKLHVVFMADIPEANELLSLDIKKEEKEKFLIISREIYLYCPNGYGKTKLNINVICIFT